MCGCMATVNFNNLSKIMRHCYLIEAHLSLPKVKSFSPSRSMPEYEDEKQVSISTICQKLWEFAIWLKRTFHFLKSSASLSLDQCLNIWMNSKCQFQQFVKNNERLVSVWCTSFTYWASASKFRTVFWSENFLNVDHFSLWPFTDHCQTFFPLWLESFFDSWGTAKIESKGFLQIMEVENWFFLPGLQNSDWFFSEHFQTLAHD